MNIADFSNRYTVNKTLRFSLIPQGSTLANLQTMKTLINDRKRADAYAKAKEILDRCHKSYIEKRLSLFSFKDDNLNGLADAYYHGNTDTYNEFRGKAMLAVSEWLCGKTDKTNAAYKALFDAKEFKNEIIKSAENDEELLCQYIK